MWLFAAAALVAGAVLGDSNSRSSSRSYDNGDEQRKRLKEEKEDKINRAKEYFKSKWKLTYSKVSKEGWQPKKIKNLYKKKNNINKDIQIFDNLLKQI